MFHLRERFRSKVYKTDKVNKDTEGWVLLDYPEVLILATDSDSNAPAAVSEKVTTVPSVVGKRGGTRSGEEVSGAGAGARVLLHCAAGVGAPPADSPTSLAGNNREGAAGRVGKNDARMEGPRPLLCDKMMSSFFAARRVLSTSSNDEGDISAGETGTRPLVMDAVLTVAEERAVLSLRQGTSHSCPVLAEWFKVFRLFFANRLHNITAIYNCIVAGYLYLLTKKAVVLLVFVAIALFFISFQEKYSLCSAGRSYVVGSIVSKVARCVFFFTNVVGLLLFIYRRTYERFLMINEVYDGQNANSCIDVEVKMKSKCEEIMDEFLETHLERMKEFIKTLLLFVLFAEEKEEKKEKTAFDSMNEFLDNTQKLNITMETVTSEKEEEKKTGYSNYLNTGEGQKRNWRFRTALILSTCFGGSFVCQYVFSTQ